MISTLIFLEMSKTNPKTKGRMVILFFINHKVIFDYLFKSSYMPV